MRTITLWVVTCWLGVAAAQPVSNVADTDVAEGRKLYQAGEAQFAVGHFVEAAKLFEASYQKTQRAELLWNLAQAYRRQAELEVSVNGKLDYSRKALAVLRNFAPLTPTEREESHLLESLLRETITKLEAVSPPPAVTPAPTVETPALTSPPPAKPNRKALWIGVGVGAGVVLVLAIGLGAGLGTRSGTDYWKQAARSCTGACQTVDYR